LASFDAPDFVSTCPVSEGGRGGGGASKFTKGDVRLKSDEWEGKKCPGPAVVVERRGASSGLAVITAMLKAEPGGSSQRDTTIDIAKVNIILHPAPDIVLGSEGGRVVGREPCVDTGVCQRRRLLCN